MDSVIVSMLSIQDGYTLYNVEVIEGVERRFAAGLIIMMVTFYLSMSFAESHP